MSEYVNPDAPNPEITEAAVRSMHLQQNGGYARPSETHYYPGGNTMMNPFGTQQQTVTSVPTSESRANIGGYQYPNSYGFGYQQQTGMSPMWNPSTNGYIGYQPPQQMAPPYNPPYNPPQQRCTFNDLPQPTAITGYNGYPIGVENNYIFDYMKNNTAPRNTWGQNYWTMPKPIEQPAIDWSPKPQQTYQNEPYSQYGMSGVSNPQLPPNFGFPRTEDSLLDQAKRNWANL